ncbi:copper resistance CopC/CopD family protein [Longimicrobium sp.]|uniref:copper resistance CopC/CopD family protein n=1 Tax=Longimicrobium sp. TaxID=2029185 RepID=UPI002C841D00|nr:CopD family protein [Longimicrobium sp.]HSU17784.1 CopD family protein [Longimicrobium sp.]
MPRSLAPFRAAAAAALLSATLVRPAPAAAHTRLQSSRPADHAAVGDTLRTLHLRFSEAVAPAMSVLELRLGDSVVARGAMRGDPADANALDFALPGRLSPGGYVASWRAASADGHVVRGTLAFTVEAAEPAPAIAAASGFAPRGDVAPGDGQPSADAGAMEDEGDSDAAAPLPVAVRWMEFLALLGMIGSVSFHLLVIRRLRGGEMEKVADRAEYGVWYLAAAAAALSLLTLLARLWLQSVALNGAADAFDGEMLNALLTGTVWGSGWILQALATVAFFLGLMVARAPHGRSVGWMGSAVAALLLAAVPALSGHAAAEERLTALAIASDWLHVLGAGVWLGTLAAVMLAGLPAAAFAGEGKATADFARIVAVFSPVALAGAGLAGATGVVNSLFHITAIPDLWRTGYGVMLLAKLALLAIVGAIGFYNWRFVLPTLQASESPSRLRRTAGAELAAGLLVVLVTAILVALPPP